MKLDTSIDKNINFDGDIKINTADNIELLYPNLYRLLNTYKSKIDENNNDWDKIKKLTNPYELIHISYRDKNNNSISKYIPLSRSYFKMWEMIYDYELLKDINVPIMSASLAEGPGGFMEAIYNYHGKKYGDKIYGITLSPSNKYIPGWSKLCNINKYKFNIEYGDLYKLEDIKKFSKNFEEEKAYLVTADGGFDYSVDFNNQEQLSYRIIFCEIVAALSIQKEGGHFICKIFDIFTKFTVKILYLLYCLYNELYIIKPRTSRMANSEKYIIAKGFRGINMRYLDELYKIVDKWDDKLSDIESIEVNDKFITAIYNYNYNYINVQVKYIDKTLEYIRKRPNKDEYKNIIREQVKNATMWCEKYKIDVNNNSSYFIHF